MKIIIVLLLTVTLLNCQTVISRNQKVQDMINQLQGNQQFYDDLITFLDEKMKNDYIECTAEIKESNCSDSQIWQQQRSKNSKNITNLREKIQKQNKTIDAILQLNKQEVTKKNLTMAMLFPQVEKLKNDIELIEDMLFIVEDTYLNLDNAGKSILLLFDHQFTHPKAQQMQKSFIQLMHKRSLFQEGPPPTANQTEGTAAPPPEEEKEKGNSEEVPLIDEEIFDGEIDHTEVEVGNLFMTTESDKEVEKQLVPDEIPDGVNVKEHDESQWSTNALKTEEQQEQEQFEDLRIYEVKEQFKADIKAMGKIIHDKLSEVMDNLNYELDMRTQSVADLEKAIIDLHHKHAKQIVQIYVETKRLQQQIFELDDQVMTLDAQIYDCLDSDKHLEECETRKGMDQVVLDDLKTEKSFNDAALIELEKLIEFEDKNVHEPEPRPVDLQIKANDQQQQEQAKKLAEKQNEVQSRINQIKSEEAMVDQQLKDQEEQKQQLQHAQPELQSMLPEHLADVPEFTSNVLINNEKLMQKKEQLVQKEEDEVLQQVNDELEKNEVPEPEMFLGNPKLMLLRKNKKVK